MIVQEEVGKRMRLECPTCQARYEVADSAIPPAGRSVQCGACGTTWFQMPAELAAADGDLLGKDRVGAREETLPPEPAPAAPSAPPAPPEAPQEWARDAVEHSAEIPISAQPASPQPGEAAALGEEFVDFSLDGDGEAGEDPPTYRTLYRKTPDLHGSQISTEDPVEAVRRSLDPDTTARDPVAPAPPPITRAPAPEAPVAATQTPAQTPAQPPSPPPAEPATEPATELGKELSSTEAETAEITQIVPRPVVQDVASEALPQTEPTRVEPSFTSAPAFDVSQQDREEVASLLAWNRSGRTAQIAAAEAEAHARAMEANPAVPGFGPQDKPALPPNRGFASGLAFALLLFLVLLSAYGLHEELAEAFPGTEPALTRYVAVVNGLRVEINVLWQQLVTAARGVA